MSSRGLIHHQAISVDRSTLAYVSLSFTYKTEEKKNNKIFEESSQVTLFLQLRLTTFIHIPSYKEDLGEEIHFTDGNDSSPCQPTYLFLTTSPMSVSME